MEHHRGHVEGMLDRDQRTAKLRFFANDDTDASEKVPKTYSVQDRTPAPVTRQGSSRSCCPTRTKTSSASSSYLSCRNGYLLNTFQSVKNVLIVVFLTLVTLPSISSAPTNMSARMMSKQMWINPCGISQDAMIVDSSEISSEELSKVIQQAGIALQNANNFKDKFANLTFNKNIDELHRDFKSQKLDWLELNLQKSLGEELPEEHLANLKVEETLLDVYGYLQKIAVGLEQVKWDQEDNEGELKVEFAETFQQLQRVLCELQETIMVHGIKMRDDVTRDVMNENDRHLDTTGRKNRDWIIYREYMNSLEYIMEAFKHLSKSAKSSGR